MKKLTCEMCGGTDIIKDDGVWVCQTCGCKYSTEEAKKMMVEGSLDVSGSTIKIDNTSFVQKYLENARRAKQKEDWEEVEKYYNLVEQNDPTNIEAIFYSSYGKAKQALLTNDQFKREDSFKVLANSISIIDDNYDINNELENIQIIKKISEDIFSMQYSNFVYTETKHDLGFDLWNTYIPLKITTDNKNETLDLFKYLHLAFIESLLNILELYNDNNCDKIIEIIPLINKHAYVVEYPKNIFEIMYEKFPSHRKEIDYYYANYYIAIEEYLKAEDILKNYDDYKDLYLTVRAKRLMNEIKSKCNDDVINSINKLLEECVDKDCYIEIYLNFMKALQSAFKYDKVRDMMHKLDLSQIKTNEQRKTLIDLLIIDIINGGSSGLISIKDIIINNDTTINNDICEYIYTKSNDFWDIHRSKILKLIPNYKDAIIGILAYNSEFVILNNEFNESTILKAISYYIEKNDIHNLDMILSNYNNELYKETIYSAAKKMKPMRAVKFYKLLNDYKDSRELYEKTKKELGIIGKFM